MPTQSFDEAFPVPTPFETGGLTKREYFALHLMAGHLAGDGALCSGTKDAQLDTPEIAARKAVQYADTLIEALNS